MHGEAVSGQQSFMAIGQGDQAADPYGRGAITDRAVRCTFTRADGNACNRLLALIVSRPWRIQCPRCKAINQAGIGMGDGA